ncbi:MAG: hypothetical protein CVT49_07415 [candidate division Zixibacteria bacterium HGW-Zixibacteria-1]|nr:MAG: hypothetical protein CVT49_07415 [candidate division Zixibacteria bacterium HGW-Zixibacteria-1]
MNLRGFYKDSIKALTLDIIQEYIREMGWTKLEEVIIDLREVYETVIYPRFECQLITDINLGEFEDRKILGKFIGKDRVVLVDKSISPPARDARFTFTLGHEFGHAALHPGGNRLFRCSSREIFSSNKEKTMEIQANLFAENLIMPDRLVYQKYYLCYQTGRPFRYTGPGEYFIYAYGIDRKIKIYSYTDLCRILAGDLVMRFSNISKESLGLKLHKLGLIANCTMEKYDMSFMRPQKGPFKTVA